MTRDEKIAKLAREISDYYATMLHMKPITPESPEYLGINSALKFTAVKYDQKMADDILDIALTLKKRVMKAHLTLIRITLHMIVIRKASEWHFRIR